MTRPPLSIRLRSLSGRALIPVAAGLCIVAAILALPALAVGWLAARLEGWAEKQIPMAGEWLRFHRMSPATHAIECFDLTVLRRMDRSRENAAETAADWRCRAEEPDSPIHHWTERDWAIWETVYWRCFDERQRVLARWRP